MNRLPTRWPKPYEAARATEIEPAENELWMIDKKTADTGHSGSLGSVIRTGRGSLVEGETYTRLLRKHKAGGTSIVMSDTPDEISDLSPILREGRGRVLVNGLGLGCVIRGLLAIEAVEHIDVVEISPELVELIGPYFEDEDRVTIHIGDAFTFTWPAGTRWDCVWHDVWDDLSADNLNESSGHARPGSYEKLHRRYGRRANWQGSWGWDFLKSRYA